MVTAPRPIPPAVRATQTRASDPASSAFVSANAGSGKTHVLVQRVIRLLLDNVPPEKILCITFTKAAAANMAERVFSTLGHWVTLDDGALDAAIVDAGIARVDARLRMRARELFASALETPGGLKVQTIHALCTRLLQQFPFEANVPARFAVLDDRDQTEMMERANLQVLLEASRDPDSATGRALSVAMASAADVTFKDVVREACLSRDHFMAWTDSAGSADAAAAQTSAALGVNPGDYLEDVEREIVDGPHLPRSRWEEVAAILGASSKADQDQAGRLREALVLSGIEQVNRYLDVFLTEASSPRKSVVTKKLCEARPQIGQWFDAEAGRLEALIERRRALTTRDRTTALLQIATAAAANYRREKQERGLLDYDDLIDKTLGMLDRVSSGWVHYKLDRGVDHVLIDEAQDTSPKQWEVIERLVAEFAAGAGARGALKRSIFAVGDDKQSIFSFQGAAPAAFAQKRSDFKRTYDGSGLAFRPVEFKYSFRSVQVVLDAVDTVFSRPEAFSGLSADAVKTVHEAVRGQAPGLVEIWPLVEPDEKPQIEGWDAPFDTTSETSPRVKLARKIAGAVRTWIARGDRVGDGDQRRPVRPGDILILVRQRGPLFEAIIRALKNAGIAVAGADRLVLTEHIAVMDLIALADALLLPDDDLALATVLKSPLFGLDEEALFALAWNRAGPLYTALRAKAGDDPVFAEAAAQLERLAEAAKRETPFAFYARLLGPEHGRRRILARLGAEATDALDEFLNLALDYERRETPSLQGFIAWLRSANAEVKRDMEIARDEVRVMTVHGAKGLEAPVVILADTTTPPAGHYPPRLLTLTAAGAPPDAAGHLVWSARKEDDIAAIAAARTAAVGAAEDEYRRLLYVAMTRAADRLVVCGATGATKKPEGCWYDLVFAALQPPASVEEPSDDGDGHVWRYRKAPPGPAETIAAAATATEMPVATRLPWLDCDAPAEMPSVVPVTPSSAYDEATFARTTTGGGTERRAALARGEAVHRLLQSLPDIPAAVRAEAARRHLARTAQDFDAEERERIIESAQAILDDARFADLFQPNSRAEVPIVGRIARPGRAPLAVAGQVDRLAVTAEAVLIADYKTNRPAPRRLDEVPGAYVTQLALYRAVLAKLYPDKPIRAALIWTDVPDLMEISGDALDAALTRLISQ
jgi:ATP-dependent helicase/nuclease subunit A